MAVSANSSVLSSWLSFSLMRAREFRALASKRLRKEVIWRMLSWTISVSSRFDQSDWTGVDIGEGLGLGLGRDKGPGWGSEDLFVCI